MFVAAGVDSLTSADVVVAGMALVGAAVFLGLAYVYGITTRGLVRAARDLTAGRASANIILRRKERWPPAVWVLVLGDDGLSFTKGTLFGSPQIHRLDRADVVVGQQVNRLEYDVTLVLDGREMKRLGAPSPQILLLVDYLRATA